MILVSPELTTAGASTSWNKFSNSDQVFGEKLGFLQGFGYVLAF